MLHVFLSSFDDVTKVASSVLTGVAGFGMIWWQLPVVRRVQDMQSIVLCTNLSSKPTRLSPEEHKINVLKLDYRKVTKITAFSAD